MVPKKASVSVESINLETVNTLFLKQKLENGSGHDSELESSESKCKEWVKSVTPTKIECTIKRQSSPDFRNTSGETNSLSDVNSIHIPKIKMTTRVSIIVFYFSCKH